jgi:hypothetical protein
VRNKNDPTAWKREKCDFVVMADQPIRFVIYWRKTSSSWLRQVPVVIWTSMDDVERIANAATADFNE